MLSVLLGSTTRARVLTVLLARPRREHHLRELIRMAGGGAAGVQREVARLEEIGLLTSEHSAAGRRVLRVVDEHPLLQPLQALVDAEHEAGRASVGTPGGVATTEASLVHPRLRSCLPALREALTSAGVRRAVLFGSAAQPRGPEPRDVDVLVSLGGPARGRAARYFALRAELERAGGLPVDLVEDEAVDNPYLRAEIERTGVTIIAAA